MRAAGVLMHITSLPSPYGIGTMGAAAFEFADFLKKGGQKYWQVLPLCPTGYGDSPYQSFSTFAGNPYLIDLDLLKRDKLLTQKEIDAVDWESGPSEVNFEAMYYKRFKLLKKAVNRFLKKDDEEYLSFLKADPSFWLEDYALFMALKDAHDGRPWYEWEEDLRLRKKAAIAAAKKKYEKEIGFWKVLQFFFKRQWSALKKYANDNGILIIGDVPIYVAYDSADVWASPKEFQLDKKLCPTEVAGCPPDAFTADGQLWGNPLYDWEKMKKENFSWWRKRMAHCFDLFDMVRIDHFRGFSGYYAIPFGDKTARNGRWREGPGLDFIKMLGECIDEKAVSFAKAVFEANADPSETAVSKSRKNGKGTKDNRPGIIAEDLGFLTADVRRLLKKSGYPGMKVLEFAFGTREGNEYRPYHYPAKCVVYVGTHDNDTACGWMKTASVTDRKIAREALNLTRAEGYAWGMMRAIWDSPADTAIVQAQDLLELGSEARMNIPSTTGNNWMWRALPGVFTDELAEKLRSKTELYGRLNP